MESLSDYEIGNLYDLDFLKLFEILQEIKEQEKKCSLQEYRKSYVNSLFSPLCSYAIEYLNENQEKPGIIGKSKVSQIDALYMVLNQIVFDLFFRREKGQIFADGKNEINYDINYEDENYYEMRINYEKEYDFKEILNIISLGEIKDNIEIDFKILKEVFKNKRREIISAFRFGYTVQERIMNMLSSHSDKEIKELPNIIFFKKNSSRKCYNEVDRIVTVKEDATISNFMVYLKTEFKNGKKVAQESFVEGKTLFLPKNSCNFIEIKTSSNFFKDKNEKENAKEKENVEKSDKFRYKTPSDKSSLTGKAYINKYEKIAKIFIEKMNEFIDLFKNLNLFYTQINLIVIIDSYFPKDFIEIAKKLSFYLADDKSQLSFKFFFVHIESDIIYVEESNKYKRLEASSEAKQNEIDQLKIDSKAKQNEIDQLKIDSKAKQNEIVQLKIDSKAKQNEIVQLKIDSKAKENEIKNLKKEFNIQLNDFQIQLHLLINKNKKRKTKKKLRNSLYDEYLKEEIQLNKNQIEKEKENNYIIGNYRSNSFQNLKKFVPSKNKYNVVIDYRTFLRLNYDDKNMDLVNDIKEKHLDKIKIFSIKEINKLILIVDYVFILSIKIIIDKFFINKEIIIKPIKVKSEDMIDEYLLFLLSMENKENSENNNSLILKDNILLYEEIDIRKINKMNDFIRFYYKLQKKNMENNTNDFPVYDLN